MLLGLWTKDMRERALQRLHLQPHSRLMVRLNVFSTFHLVVFAWIFFRANTLSDAFMIIRNMFRLTTAELLTFGLILIMLLLLFGLKPLHEHRPIGTFLQTKSPLFRWAFYIILTLMIINLGVSSEVPFIYFQF